MPSAPPSPLVRALMQFAEQSYEDGLRRVCAAEGVSYAEPHSTTLKRTSMFASLGYTLSRRHPEMGARSKRGRPSMAVHEQAHVQLAKAVNDILDGCAERGEQPPSIVEIANRYAEIVLQQHGVALHVPSVETKIRSGRRALRKIPR